MNDELKNQFNKTVEELINSKTYPDEIENLEGDTLHFEKTPKEIEEQRSQLVKDSVEKAQSMMDSMLKIYVKDGFIERSQYVKAKLALNTSNLTSIIKQIGICERAIDIVMNNIESGEMNPKFFDSLGNLQKTMLELIKTQQVLNTTVEADFKHIGTDIMDTDDDDDDDNDVQNTYKTSDSKSLMRMINNAVEQQKKNQVQDIESVQTDDTSMEDDVKL